MENRLVSATPSGGTAATLRYDPLGRLYETGGTAGLTRFLYDGDELVAEFDGNTGVVLRRYLHGSAVDDPVLVYEGAAFNQPKLLYANHQGSIVAVSDITGVSAHKNSYDEWGIPKGASTPENTADDNVGRFQYTGQAWIPEVGLYYYKARFYSPTLGRFMQTDPVGYDDQVNLYAYVANDPVNFVDPTGKQSIELYPRGDIGEPGARQRPTYPGYAIVALHGWEDGRVQGPNGQAVSAQFVLDKLLAAGYPKGRPIILLSCNTARGNFPSDLAKLSGGLVYAAGGFVRIPTTEEGVSNFTFTSNTGRNKSGEASGWLAYHKNGTSNASGISSIKISAKDGVASITITKDTQLR